MQDRQRSPGNDQTKANPKRANNSSSKPPHHKTHNPNATKHKIKWTPTNLSMCPAPPSKKRVALSQTPTRAKCSSNKYADLDIIIEQFLTIEQKASLLRSRLQSAMRNVTDHQFDRRVSELEAHSRKCPRLSLSVLSTPPLSSRKHFTSFPSSQMKTPRIGCAGFTSTPSHSTPDLPGRPSPLSSSVVQQRTKSHAQRTPPRGLGSPMQLSSPPATVIRREADRESPRAELSMDDVDDMSPSQRGDAVDGLLKLMSTTGNQSSDSWTG